MVIGVDFDVIRFHGELTEQYVYTILNIVNLFSKKKKIFVCFWAINSSNFFDKQVSTLFRKLSIINITKIVIKRLIMYHNPEDSAVSICILFLKIINYEN